MILSLFAVEAVGNVDAVLVAESNNCRNSKRDTLISRTEESFNGDIVLVDALSVVFTELGELSACLIVTAVYEVGSLSAALEREFTESEHSAIDHKSDKAFLVSHIMYLRNIYDVD